MRFQFGAFELDLGRRELRTADGVIPLEPKAFAVLGHLVTQRDRAVAKTELLDVGWPEEFVKRCRTDPLHASHPPRRGRRWGPAAGHQDAAGLWLPLCCPS